MSTLTSKSISTKFLSKEEVVELSNKDYLTLSEITPRILKQVRPDMLYRTHTALHRDAKGTVRSKKIVKAHALVSDELKSRGFLHHAWDRLDAVS